MMQWRAIRIRTSMSGRGERRRGGRSGGGKIAGNAKCGGAMQSTRVDGNGRRRHLSVVRRPQSSGRRQDGKGLHQHRQISSRAITTAAAMTTRGCGGHTPFEHVKQTVPQCLVLNRTRKGRWRRHGRRLRRQQWQRMRGPSAGLDNCHLDCGRSVELVSINRGVAMID